MKEISLALGGGGVRGIAHIGVIQALHALGFKIKAVAGTSAGGIIGGLYASGKSIEEIVDFIHTAMQNRKKFARRKQDQPSLLGLEGFEEDLEAFLGKVRIEDLAVKFATTAVDVNSGQEIIFCRGGLKDAIRATIAVPGIFPAFSFGNYELVDGAILDPVPVRLARWLAPKVPVLAVCLTPKEDQWASVSPLKLPASTGIPMPILETLSHIRYARAFQIFTTSMDITSRMLTELRLKVDQPEILIRPEVYQTGILDDVNPNDMIKKGAEAVENSIDQLNRSFYPLSRFLKKKPIVEIPGIPIP